MDNNRVSPVDALSYQVDEIIYAHDIQYVDVTPENEWYVKKRTRALTSAVSDKKWNPNLHPRGRDGKFISKGGFVRFIVNGVWWRGKVTNIDPENGAVSVTADDTEKYVFKSPSSNLYQAVTPKAVLQLPPNLDPDESQEYGFKKVGGQAGSNPGGFFELTEDKAAVSYVDFIPVSSGTKFYVKKSKSIDHAANEILANDLYRLAGVRVPNVYINSATNGDVIASQIARGDQKPLSEATPEQLSELRTGFVVDAWLANWDVIGLSLDNTVIVDGVPVRIDAGGAIRYRAQGSPKGSAFGATVGELDSLKSSSVNPQAASIFGSITDDELRDGAERLAAINPMMIKSFVKKSGVSSPDALADTLIARRAYILEKLGVPDAYKGTNSPHAGYDPTPKQSSVPEDVTPTDTSIDVPTSTPDTGAETDEDVEKPLPPITDEEITDTPAFTSVTKVDDDKVHLLEQGTTVLYIPKDSSVSATPIIGEVEGFQTLKYEGYNAYIDLRSLTTATNLSRKDEQDSRITAGVTKPKPESASWNAPKQGEDWPGTFYVVEIDEAYTPDAISLKQNGTLVMKGQAIGTWKQDESKISASIEGEFTLNGKEAKVSVASGWMSNVGMRRRLTGEIKRRVLVQDNVVGYEGMPGYVPGADQETDGNPNVKVISTPSSTNDIKPGDYVRFTSTKETGEAAVVAGRILLVGTEEQLKEGTAARWLSPIADLGTPDGKISKETLAQLGIEGSALDTQVNINSDVENPYKVYGTTRLFEVIEPLDASFLPSTTTFKPNGTIVSKNQIIGTWVKKGSGTYNTKYYATIFPMYSANGKRVNLETSDQEMLRMRVTNTALVAPATSAPKDLTTKKPKATAMKAATSVPSGLTVDGKEVSPGLTVQHASGVTGKVTSWPNQEKYPGLVYVQLDDGKKKTYNVSKLTVVESSVSTSTDPDAYSTYAGVKTADGKTPVPGQKIKTGKAELTGTLLKVNPKNGYVTVLLDSGEKKITTLNTTYVLEDASPEVPAGATAAVVAVSKPAKAPKHYGTPLSELTVTLPMQSDEEKILYQAGGKRSLLSDGSVPYIGMFVLDKQGNSFVVAGIPDAFSKTPNSLKLVPLAGGVLDPDKKYSRSVSSLAVDVDKENKKGAAVSHITMIMGPGPYNVSDTKLVEFDVPPGALIFRKENASRNNLGDVRVVTPSGQVYAVMHTGTGSAFQLSSSKVDMTEMMQWSLVGYGAPESDTQYVASGGQVPPSSTIDNYNKKLDESQTPYTPPQKTSFTISKKSVEEAGSVEQLVAQVALNQYEATTGIELPSYTPVANPLVPPPKPKELVDTKPKTIFPQATGGSGEQFDAKLTFDGSKSVREVVSEVIANKDSEAANSAARYAVIDGDVINDQTMRLQVVVGPDGKEYVEARFKLQPGAADAIGTKILTTNNEPGGWISENKSVTELSDGDAIVVRSGTTAGVPVLKPQYGASIVPNARISGSPVQIVTGDPEKGTFDRYRFTVVLGDGSVGEVDFEDRGAGYQVFTYDFNKPNTSGSATMSSDAEQEGWARIGAIGQFEVASLGPDGKKTYASLSSVKDSTHFGSTLSRQLDDGTLIRMSYVHPSQSGATEKYDTPRFHTWNNETMILVPLDTSAESPETAVQEGLSNALEVLGLSDRQQRPPTLFQLRTMAVIKLAYQFDKDWKPNKDYMVDGNPNNAETVKLFDEVGKRLELGRPVTFDDFIVYVDSDGRVNLGLSDELADAVTKITGRYIYSHHSSSDAYVSMITGTNNGLLSTDERWSRGVFTSGKSSGTDLVYGSGDRVYLTGNTSKTYNQISTFVVPARIVHRSLNGYMSPGDSFGKTHANWLGGGSVYESMFKGKLPLEAVVAIGGGPNIYDMMDTVKARSGDGSTTLSDGRKAEDVIVPGGKILTADGGVYVVTKPDGTTVVFDTKNMPTKITKLTDVGSANPEEEE